MTIAARRSQHTASFCQRLVDSADGRTSKHATLNVARVMETGELDPRVGMETIRLMKLPPRRHARVMGGNLLELLEAHS